jgi:ABC-type transport system involved in multi-copper enzyme maturation permease subunit
MTAIAPYRSGVAPGRAGFAPLLRAEWVKFRSVRGWVIGMIVAVLAIVALGLGPGMQGSCGTRGPASVCTQPLGPGGEAVTDSFYFVHRRLGANGSITVAMTSLTGLIPNFSGDGGGGGGGGGGAGESQTRAGLVPWAKAGIIVKASAGQGSAYAAMMVTGGNGVRMQYDYTGDVAAQPAPGAAGSVSAASPRWLRLTRSGDTLTGYDSADGRYWTKVAAVTLTGLPSTVLAGLFATSPQYSQVSGASVSGGPSQATGVFDRLSLLGTWPGGAWTGSVIGDAGGPAAGSPGGFTGAAGTFTVSGTGDIAPLVSGAAGIGVTIAQTLIGVFAGLIAIVVVGAMFMTAEYRRGLIRVTLAATPRRGAVLAAKAVVIAAVAFAAGLVSSAIVVIEGQRLLRARGVYVWPVTALTEVRVIVGTAAVLAVAAVIAVAIGAVLRRSAGAVAAVIVVIVLPYLLIVALPLLPVGPVDWLARVTPAAAFAVQGTLVQYQQVSNVYTPSAGYYPLAPWAGFAVLCAWAAVALGLAAYLLHRRDA